VTEIPFKDAPFPITGGTAELSMDDRFGQRIHVAEFKDLNTTGTFGGGTGNDSPCIQAAFDLAFGNASTPHGEADKNLNRVVEFPPGNFRCTSTLNLTRVVGGYIVGAGYGPTRLFYDGTMPGGSTLTPLLNINGATGLVVERMVFRGGGGLGVNGCAINLDWDGTSGGDGLKRNMFTSVGIEGGEYGIIIGHAGGLQGNNNMFVNCNVGSYGVGIDVRGPQALSNSALGGGGAYNSIAYVRCPAGGGSFHAQCVSVVNALDFIMESNNVMHIAQCRTESSKLLRMENGLVSVQALTIAGGVAGFAEVNGGVLTLECSELGYTEVSSIIGTGGKVNLMSIIASDDGSMPAALLADYEGTVGYNPDGWPVP
jgi:hypothetical protein